MVDYEKYKIIISKNSYINPIYEKDINIADSMCYIVESNDNFIRFKSFINGNIFKYLVHILKTGKSHYEVLSMINRNTEDLTEEETKFIENNV